MIFENISTNGVIIRYQQSPRSDILQNIYKERGEIAFFPPAGVEPEGARTVALIPIHPYDSRKLLVYSHDALAWCHLFRKLIKLIEVDPAFAA